MYCIFILCALTAGLSLLFLAADLPEVFIKMLEDTFRKRQD